MTDQAVWLPGIIGFKSLFVDKKQPGFRDKSRILVAGPAGSGKTIFSLATVRDLMATNSNSHLYYMSTEVTKAKLERDYAVFGWFSKEDEIFNFDKGRVIIPELPGLGLYHRPTGASGLVELALESITTTVNHNQATLSTGQDISNAPKSFVIVDSLTAFLKDCSDWGERRRQAYKFVTQLSQHLSMPSLIFLITEQSFRSGASETEAPPEEYIADIVFKLSLRDRGQGRRLRTLELTKSHGTNMLMGEHSFLIASSNYIDNLVVPLSLQNEIRTQATKGTRSEDAWGTILVTSRPRLRAIGSPLDNPQKKQLPVSSGTPGLDDMLTGAPYYWLKNNSGKIAFSSSPGLHRGSTTLLMGSSGTGKTIMALQFLLAQKEMSKTLYVSFENPLDHVIQMYPGENKERLRKCYHLYRRRANLDLNLWLYELGDILEKNHIERVVIDGLSDLLSIIPGYEYSNLVETLLGQIKSKSTNATILITYELSPNFKGYTPQTEGLSMAADTVIVLRHLPINDELRKTVHILKARGQHPSSQVREVVISGQETQPLRLEQSLEAYSNLLGEQPTPLGVSLQLFAENQVEKEFNAWISKRLQSLVGYRIKVSGFSRPEMTRTLEEVMSRNSLVPSTNIKVLSLDEWWFREYRVSRHIRDKKSRETRIPHPMLPLNKFFAPEHFDIGKVAGENVDRYVPKHLTSISEYWLFEVDKATVLMPFGNTNQIHEPILGLPHYMDYGLFCVNAQVWQHCLAEQASQQPLGILESWGNSERWLHFLEKSPRVWAAWNGQDFEKPDASKVGMESDAGQIPSSPTLVDFIKYMQRNDSEFVGFAFDMEAIHTVLCTYLELCWAFGSPENFLIKHTTGYFSEPSDCDKRRKYVQALPATKAVRFLQFLVREGLMPARPTNEDCKKALFSRQWYSTLCEISEQQNTSLKKGQTSVPKNTFCALPFFPVGYLEKDQVNNQLLINALEDALERLQRLVERMKAALIYRGAKADEQVRKTVDNVLIEIECIATVSQDKPWEWVRLLCETSETIREQIAESAYFIPGKLYNDDLWDSLPQSEEKTKNRIYISAARSMDSRDIYELLRWHEFRVGMIAGQLNGTSFYNVLRADIGIETGEHTYDEDRFTQTEQTVQGTYERSPLNGKGVTSLTGYACDGSWMLGVLSSTHSPNIAWKLIEEMTSLESAKERSAKGAGLPSRKDFFEFHGNENIRHADHLTWNNMLKYAGSRARRRDRSLCAAVHVSGVSTLIYHRLRDCLLHADNFKKRWGVEDPPEKWNEAKKKAWDKVTDKATEMIEELLTHVHHEMKINMKDSRERDTCVICPDVTACKHMLKSQEREDL